MSFRSMWMDVMVSVAHAESSVDRDHSPRDVAGGIGDEKSDDRNDIVDRSQPLGRDALEVPGNKLLRQSLGHVRGDETGSDKVAGLSLIHI